MKIYKVTNTMNGKGYVGQTRQSPGRRWYKHQWDARRDMRCKALSNALNKYGPDAFTFEVLETLPRKSTQEELDAAELKWIAAAGTFWPKGYNLTRGGGSSGGRSAATKRRIAENTVKQMAALTPEQRAERMRVARAAVTPEQEAYRLKKLREAFERPALAQMRREQARTMVQARWAKHRQKVEHERASQSEA